MKTLIILSISLITGCTSSHIVGNMQMDCINGGWHPSACVVTVSHKGQFQYQQIVSESGASKAVIGGATTVGGMYLLGAGIGKAGSRTTNNNNQSGGNATSDSSSKVGNVSAHSSSESELTSKVNVDNDVSVKSSGGYHE